MRSVRSTEKAQIGNLVLYKKDLKKALSAPTSPLSYWG